MPKVCGRQCPSFTKAVAKFIEVAAVIIHHAEDRMAEWTTLVPRPRHPNQITEREVVAPQAIYCAYQAKAPAAVAQLTSVPLPAAIEELLETDQVLISAADLYG